MSNIREQYASAYRMARTGKLEPAIEMIRVMRENDLIAPDMRVQRILLAARSAFNCKPDHCSAMGSDPYRTLDSYNYEARCNPLPDQLWEVSRDRAAILRGKLARVAWRIRLRNNFAHGNYPFTIRPFASNSPFSRR